jgi:undecaprenyl-diphosphatase
MKNSTKPSTGEKMDQRIRVAVAIAGLLVFAAMAYPLLCGYSFGFDLPVRAAIHARAFPALTAIMRSITALGSEYFLAPVAAFLVWRLAKRGERRTAYLLVTWILTAEAVLQLLKVLLHRPRPEVFFGLVPAETYSFPSGHSFVPVVYFGILAAILRAGPRGRAAVIVAAALLGCSRVYLGYHYPSDVVAGWALAAVWLAMWAFVADRRRASRLDTAAVDYDRGLSYSGSPEVGQAFEREMNRTPDPASREKLSKSPGMASSTS